MKIFLSGSKDGFVAIDRSSDDSFNNYNYILSQALTICMGCDILSEALKEALICYLWFQGRGPVVQNYDP